MKNDYQKALLYYENAKIILDSVFNLEKSKTINTLESKMQLEKKEKELALLAKDNELNKISSEKRAKELEIAKKHAEAEQLLHWARQEKDKRKADSLKNLAQKSRLEAEKLSAQKQIQEKDFQNEIFRQKRLQNTYLLIVLAVILLLIFIAFILKQKQAANRILAQKNNEILLQKEELLVLTATLETQKETVTSTYQKLKSTSDILEKSIRYASHIQSVVLPEESEMRTFFSDLFIIFRPRNVVSGDFYWFSKISEEKAVFALADCTGHGVPGAFMSMLGATLLHETVNIKKVQDDAGRILRNVNSGLRKILKQELKKNNDGMEIALCIFEKNNEKKHISVIFAGAKSHIACVSAGEFFELKGDRKDLGGDGKSIEFQNHSFDVPFNTVFYFYTDGFQDQNNPQKERLGSSFLKEILKNNSEKDMQTQKTSLEKQFDAFRAESEQRDDVSVIGLLLK
jgi:serine phosphatase RsbU (regulator of sigma subunit)